MYSAVETDEGSLRTRVSNKAQGIGSLSHEALPTETISKLLNTSINCTPKVGYNRLQLFLKKLPGESTLSTNTGKGR